MWGTPTRTRCARPARAIPLTESGLVVVDKPPGWTSHDVVGRMRRLAGTRKVGHAGTLDPMATGVLLVGVNRATRLLGHLQVADKAYDATIRLGRTTVTDDAEGEETSSTDASTLDPDTVRAAMAPLTGQIQQVPSAVSAIKVDGVRSYARVRAGEAVELSAREVTVSTFDLVAARVEGEALDVEVRVVCSSGTYVRALARDLGRALGVGGHLTTLRRTRVGPFGLDVAHTLDELEAELVVHGLDQVARTAFGAIDLTAGQADDVGYGRPLADLDLYTDAPVAVFAPSGRFLALYRRDGALARPVAVFAGR